MAHGLNAMQGARPLPGFMLFKNCENYHQVPSWKPSDLL